MTTIIKAGSPADLLSLIPSMLGYEPRESLIALAIGEDSRSIGTMRLAATDALIDSGGEVVRWIRKIPGIDSVILVLYTEQGGEYPFHVEGVLSHWLVRDEVHLQDFIHVGKHAWRSQAEAGTLDELPPLPEGVKPPAKDPLAIPDLGEIQYSIIRAGYLANEQVTWERYAEHIDALAGVGDVTDFQLGEIAGLLDDVGRWSWVIHRVTRGHEAPPSPDGGLSFSLLMGLDSRRPDARRIEAAIENLRTAAGAVTLPGVFAALAWLEWALGRPSIAQGWVKRAQSCSDEFIPAHIVDEMCDKNLHPTWVFDPSDPNNV